MFLRILAGFDLGVIKRWIDAAEALAAKYAAGWPAWGHGKMPLPRHLQPHPHPALDDRTPRQAYLDSLRSVPLKAWSPRRGIGRSYETSPKTLRQQQGRLPGSYEELVAAR
jgi:hypothetical protein